MITKTANTIANLKNLWIEMFLNKTDRVSTLAAFTKIMYLMASLMVLQRWRKKR